MGYHVRILRTQAGQELPISRDEVEVLARNIGAKIEPSSLRGAELDFVLPVEQGARSYRFIFQHGQLWTNNPEEDELVAMIEVANRLNARVRGDEFETYRSANETYIHSDDKNELDQSEVVSKRAVQRTKRTRTIFFVIQISSFLLLLAGLLFAYLRQRA